MTESTHRTLDEILCPPDQQDDFTAWMVREAGFRGAKRMPDGNYAGIMRLAFTNAICLGVTPSDTFTFRFCYEDSTQCLSEYQRASSINDQLEGWVARRPVVQSDYDFNPEKERQRQAKRAEVARKPQLLP